MDCDGGIELSLKEFKMKSYLVDGSGNYLTDDDGNRLYAEGGIMIVLRL